MNTRKHPQSVEGKTILLKDVMISLYGYQNMCMMSLKLFSFFSGSTITNLDPTQPTSATQIPPTVDSASSVFTPWSQYIFVLILCLAILIINALMP